MPRFNPHSEATLTERSSRRPRGSGSETASGRRMSRAEYMRALHETDGATDDELRERIHSESDPELVERLARKRDPLRNPRGRAAREHARFSHPLHWGSGAAGRHVPKRRVGSPTLRPPSRLSASDGTGFALGILLYVLGMNYLRNGMPGVTGWFNAKFFNKPGAGPGQPQPRGNSGLIPKGKGGAGQSGGGGGGGGGGTW
jgi:hypothetical protein